MGLKRISPDEDSKGERSARVLKGSRSQSVHGVDALWPVKAVHLLETENSG